MERRKMQLYENNQLVKTRIYCGMYEKETDSAANVKQYCYIAGGNGVTAVLINEELYFLRRDVQGTITGLVNQNDSIVEEYSYDAWGRRRNPTNWTYDSVAQPQYMHRGYTMHEMLDEFGLINMNGRCYDPVVGRFLSPDIVVQNPNYTQSYNRYSYCINNPLKYSDPSGWVYGRGWLRWHTPSNVSSRQRAIDLIFGNNWKPSEFNELAGLLDMAGGNSLNNAGAPLDLCDQQLGAFKMAIGNMEKRPALTWSAVTTKYDDGTYATRITYFLDNKVVASASISNSIECSEETTNFKFSTINNYLSMAGYIVAGIGADAKFEAGNFTYLAGERSGNIIISAEKFGAGGRLFFRDLAKYAKWAGKGVFVASTIISIVDMIKNPDQRTITIGALDIAFSAFGTFGGPGGQILSGYWFAMRLTTGEEGINNYFDFYENNPGFVPKRPF